jgi:hypothetical protein
MLIGIIAIWLLAHFFKLLRNSIQRIKMSTMKKPLANKKNKQTGQKPLPGARTEKDADDLVHSQQEELPKEAGEEDLDELVHRPHKQQPDSLNKSKLEDPDDLVHNSNQEGEDDDYK